MSSSNLGFSSFGCFWLDYDWFFRSWWRSVADAMLFSRAVRPSVVLSLVVDILPKVLSRSASVIVSVRNQSR